MSVELVYATETARLMRDELPFQILAGQPWHAKDELVRLHPSFFSKEPLPQLIGHSELGALPSWLTDQTEATESQKPARVRS